MSISIDVKCGRPNCAAVAYRRHDNPSLMVIECGKNVEHCPNGSVQGDDVAALEAEWVERRYRDVEGNFIKGNALFARAWEQGQRKDMA